MWRESGRRTTGNGSARHAGLPSTRRRRRRAISADRPFVSRRLRRHDPVIAAARHRLVRVGLHELLEERSMVTHGLPEILRQAMRHHRALFEELVETDADEPVTRGRDDGIVPAETTRNERTVR